MTEQDKEGKCQAQPPPLRVVSNDGNIAICPHMIQKADGSWTLDNPEALKEFFRARFAGRQRRDWIIFLRLLEGFKIRFGCWPTCLHLPRDMFDYLRNYLLTREEYSKINKKVKLIPDDKLIIAKDKSRIHDFMEDGYPSSLDVNPTGWLGIDPNLRRTWEDGDMSITLPSIDGKDEWVYVQRDYKSECYYNNKNIKINRKSKQIKVWVNIQYNDIGRQCEIKFKNEKGLDITGYQELSHTLYIVIFEYINLKYKLVSYTDFSLYNDILTSYDNYKNTWIDILPNTKSNDIIIKLHYDYDLNSTFLQKAYNRLCQRIITHAKKLFPKRKPQRMMCGTFLVREPSNSQSIILPIIRKK